MRISARAKPWAGLAIAAMLSGCATAPAQPTGADPATGAATQAAEPRFDVNGPGAVGIAVLAGVAVLALLVASDDALSFGS